MAEIYTNILMSMMDSFSSIISNRLSQIMKFLTSVTIILATPTLIYSLWGINVPVPFESSPFGFVEVTLLGVAVTVAVTFVLWKRTCCKRINHPAIAGFFVGEWCIVKEKRKKGKS